MQSQSQSGQSTPDARFIAQAAGAEEASKEQTFGLVNLSDFRKRRADALEHSGHDSSESDGRKLIAKPAGVKKRKKKAVETLSFGDDEQDDESGPSTPSATVKFSRASDDAAASEHSDAATDTVSIKTRLKPNTSVNFVPKSQSKTALARDAQLKQALQKEYMLQQELVKATEFMLPFVFFDGRDSPGGKVRMRKGDHIWLFLERARKVGAETAGKTNDVRKDWARISVDDLMIVRQDLILPPHFIFHYFILNGSIGYQGPLFTLSSVPAAGASEPQRLINETSVVCKDMSGRLSPPNIADSALEGFSDDPVTTKVVDRRWYERNKHIFPASMWEEYDPDRDYAQGGRKDRDGNQMFFSR